MVRTRPCTTASCAGAGRGCSPDLHRACQRQRGDRHCDDRRDASQGTPHLGEPAQKGAVPRRITLEPAAHRRSGQRLSRAATVLPGAPGRRGSDRLQGPRQRLVPRCPLRRDIEPCIPGRSNRKALIPYDADLYKQRSRIERMFGRLKDWRRIATRYDRCAHTFMSAICIAASVIFWL
jgi:transposase